MGPSQIRARGTPARSMTRGPWSFLVPWSLSLGLPCPAASHLTSQHVDALSRRCIVHLPGGFSSAFALFPFVVSFLPRSRLSFVLTTTT